MMISPRYWCQSNAVFERRLREGLPISQSIVSFRTVRKAGPDGRLILRGLTFDVQRGEVLTLMGPSGSGKTTALRMLAGLDVPDAGTILLDDEHLTRAASGRRGIAFMPQDYTLFTHLSVGENVAFPLAQGGVPGPERARLVAQVLDRMQLSGFADRRPATLSGGQRQRVALARALVWNPALLLLDEPLGALDQALRASVQDQLRVPGSTAIHVTHDLALALAVSDRIAVLREGVVVQLGPPAELYDRPATAWVAGFLGQNNVLSGRVIAEADDQVQVLLACGPVVEARAGEGLEPGRACMVCIRPERIAFAAGDLGEGALSATLESVRFAGDHLRLQLRVGDARITVKRPAGAGLGGAAPGMVVSIAWQAHHAMAYPGQDA